MAKKNKNNKKIHITKEEIHNEILKEVNKDSYKIKFKTGYNFNSRNKKKDIYRKVKHKKI